MNREIKLIAWDGLRFTTSGIMFNNTTGCIETPIGANMKLLQYTPYKDKKGEDIIEGDLLRASEPLPLTGKPSHVPRFRDYNSLYKVIFHEGAFKIQISNSKKKHLLSSVLIRENGFIKVGNAFANPELLNNHQ